MLRFTLFDGGEGPGSVEDLGARRRRRGIVPKDLTGHYYAKLIKSLSYLEYTYGRVKDLSVRRSELTPEQLERGSFRDYLHRAEKLKLIDSSEVWLDIRELRNVAVHEYTEGDLEEILRKFVRYAPLLLDLRTRLARIDVVVAAPEHLESDEFLSSIYPDAIRLA